MPDSGAPADVVMVIRHAEKPTTVPNTRGVTLQGKPDKGSLTPAGWVRAGALLDLLAPTAPNQPREGLFRPASLFASNTKGPQHGSDREEQTLALLSFRLQAKTNTDHGVGEESLLVKSVHQAASPVLICWEHRHIATIAALLGSEPSPPERWPKPRFDMVWVFTRDDPNRPYSFIQVPELLLPGDLDTPI
jgi:hypothetical protein